MFRPPIRVSDEFTGREVLSGLDSICNACESQVKCSNCVINDIRSDVLNDYQELTGE